MCWATALFFLLGRVQRSHGLKNHCLWLGYKRALEVKQINNVKS
jgi:hypothetical protein